MYRCVNFDEEFHVKTKWDCLDLGGDWVNADFHWDNILYGIFNLFVIANCEGWLEFLIEAWEAVDVNYEPSHHGYKFWSIFFILFFLVGNLMVFNTFIGVLIEKFIYIKDSFSKNNYKSKYIYLLYNYLKFIFV